MPTPTCHPADVLLIKSRDRVKDLAEVYTPGHVVEDMLDLVSRQSLATSHRDVTRNPGARFLEPACGNGNFLEAILTRKLSAVAGMKLRQERFEFQTLLATTSVYGIDIDAQNVEEARERLRTVVLSHYSKSRRGSAWRHNPGFDAALDYVLRSNVVLGDSLNGAGQITFVEYTASRPERRYPQHFDRSVYTLADLLQAGHQDGMLPFDPVPLRSIGPTHYLALAGEPTTSAVGR